MSYKRNAAVLITSYGVFGDLLYQTPLIRMLKKLYHNLDVWCRNPEPFFNNPNIRSIFKLDSFYCPEAFDFYGSDVFRLTADTMKIYPQSSFHTVDFFTIGASRMVLRDCEKYLEAFWTKEDEAYVRGLLAKHELISCESTEANFCAICPAITWPSRTLSLDYYKELIEKIQSTGDKVVLVGKDVNYLEFDPKKDSIEMQKELAVKEAPKQLYSPLEFPNTICLYNQLSFAQLCAFYSLTKIAVNTENGNHVASMTNNNCWNVYIPSATAPEFRIPHRFGSQRYKAISVGNDKEFYPGSHYSLQAGELINAHVELPSVDKVFTAYKAAREGFKNGLTEVSGIW